MKILPHASVLVGGMVPLLFLLPVAVSAANTTVQVKFLNHIQAGLPEQDVFVGGEGLDPDKITRVDVKDAAFAPNLVKELFAAAKAVAHDPFKVGKKPLGPFAKGKSLGLTLRQWLAARGGGMYRTDGNGAHLNLWFTRLVPRGRYTVWCSRVTFPPSPKVVDYPCGAADGSQNSFRALANGAASFRLNLDPLPPSTRETKTVLAIAYHSDSKTYGADPGAFGLNSHVQLFFALPELPPELTGSPAKGWALHADAIRHFPGNRAMIAHHYCKPVMGELEECQLYDSDDAGAKLVGMEVIVSPKMFKSFSAEEKKLWHYHKEEIPKVDVSIPGLSAAEQKALIKSFEETYGKIYLLWDPAKQQKPLGHPIVVKP